VHELAPGAASNSFPLNFTVTYRQQLYAASTLKRNHEAVANGVGGAYGGVDSFPVRLDVFKTKAEPE
jgi:hypothetical protein